jgi:hypothetical protein
MEKKVEIIKNIYTSLGSPGLVNMFLYLEEIFDKHPDGFYRFISPCKSPYYEAATSICEQTGTPSITISNRLSKLCATYRSTTSYNDSLRLFGEDGVFQGMPYLRYMDKRSYKTYFMRNAKGVESIANGIPFKRTYIISKINVPKLHWIGSGTNISESEKIAS